MSTQNLMRAASPQAELLGPDGLLDVGLLESAKEFVHTGARASLDQERCAVALALLGAGVSRRKVAERLGMSRNTLDAVEQLGERGGRLEPLKERVSRELSRLVSDAATEIRDTIHSGSRSIESAAWVKSVATALGIGFDKHALSTGGATEIIEHRIGPSRDEQERFLSGAVEVEVVTPDVESGGNCGFPVGLGQFMVVGSGSDTPVPKQSPDCGQSGAAENGGGGGARVSAGSESNDGFTSVKILSEGGTL
jgi:hypothetical protein